MRKRRTSFFALAGVLVSSTALANSGGVGGYSGKPSAMYPSGESCNQCHSGGTAPTVALNGPASLAAGSSAEYTLVVTTGLSRAGAGVAATDGVALTPGAGMRNSFGEMVHDDPQVVSGGSMSFKFTVKAPASGSAIKLWAVGLAANNANAANGDRATHVTRDITITGGSPPPLDAGTGGGGDAGGTGGGDGGGGSTGTGGGDGTGTGGGDGTGTGGGGTDPDGDGPLSASPDGDEDDGTGGSSRRRGAGAEPQSCTTTRLGNTGLASPVALGFSAAALVASVARRRRRRS